MIQLTNALGGIKYLIQSLYPLKCWQLISLPVSSRHGGHWFLFNDSNAGLLMLAWTYLDFRVLPLDPCLWCTNVCFQQLFQTHHKSDMHLICTGKKF